MTNIVYIGGGKGVPAKRQPRIWHAWAPILRNQPTAYVLTDPERKVRGEGRPYGVLDGRRPEQLAQILSASQSSLNGWLIIDGGGNRPAVDRELSAEAQLCLLPFRASEEELDTVATDLQRLPQAIAWPTAWPTNPFAEKAAQFYSDGLAEAFPRRVILQPVPFVNAVAELPASALTAPSTPARHAGRNVFGTIEDFFRAYHSR
jgi:chromosome partitioning protein